MSNSVFCMVVTLNLLAFLLYAWDKFAAVMHWRRVSERTLTLSAIPFSAVGAFLGMYVFRHKIRKPSFQLWVVLLLLVQVGLIVWMFTRRVENVF